MAKLHQPRLILLVLGLLLIGFLAGTAVSAATSEPGSDQDPLVTKSYVDQATQFQVVNLQKGQRLEAFAGTELIVRGGEATAIASSQGGLADVTSGFDIKTGQTVSANHLLIIARSDGRGIKAVSDDNVVVMVRGQYVIH